MLTDKNLLILTGRHQPVCTGAPMRIWWDVFSLQVAGLQWIEISGSKDEMHFTSETCNTHFKWRNSRWPGAVGTYRVWVYCIALGSLSSKAKFAYHQGGNKRQVYTPSLTLPSPSASTSGLTEKTYLFCTWPDKAGADLTYLGIIYRVLRWGKDHLPTKTQNLFFSGRLRKAVERQKEKEQILFLSQVTTRTKKLPASDLNYFSTIYLPGCDFFQRQ